MIVCDGMDEVVECIVWVFYNDFVMGVMCYVDVGYDIVKDCVVKYNLDFFMVNSVVNN